MDLHEMKNTDIRKVDRENLIDIGAVKISDKKSKEEKFAGFMQKIKNPYCYLCGEYVVKLSFSDTNRSLQEALVHYLQKKM